LLQCCARRYQVSLIAGTVFHKTRTPLVKWFWAFWMVSRDKGGTSATRKSRQLELSYRTAWTMLHKLRKAMGQRDALYTLTGSIEMDDAYFGGKGNGKVGRGTARTSVVLMVEERGEHAGYIAIKALTAASKPQLTAAA
jgi:molybdenum-dependent DNA-binding transcriptional regulator ModE